MAGTFPEFVINPAGLAEIMRGPDGPVTRHMIVLGDEVKLKTIASLKSGFPRDFLGPTIVKRINVVNGAASVMVGTEHGKTEPHTIRGNPLLAFEWPSQGAGTFFFAFVNHPGSDFTHGTPAHPDGYIQEKLTLALEETTRSV